MTNLPLHILAAAVDSARLDLVRHEDQLADARDELNVAIATYQKAKLRSDIRRLRAQASAAEMRWERTTRDNPYGDVWDG